MKIKNTLFCIFFAASLGACEGANSSQYITYYLEKGFVGHPVNEFFYEYGYPMGEFDLADGDKTYRWSSVKLPPLSTRVFGVFHFSAKHDNQQSDSYQGTIVRQYCELRIYTDRTDTIKGFAIAIDSIGKSTSSRCSEIFDRTYP